MARGGKRAGSGRKPIHGKRKLSNFSTRITPELREALERAAKRSGHSLSQEVERRLTDSLQAAKRDRDFWGGDRNLALAQLVNRAAQIIEGHTGESWMTNDYTFRVLRAAVEELFRILEVEIKSPGRDTNVPAKIRETADADPRTRDYIESRTPEQSGQFFANSIWTNIMILEMPGPSHPTNDSFRALAILRNRLGIKPSKRG